MSLETLPLNTKEVKESLMMVTGVDSNNEPIYEEMTKPLPEIWAEPPTDVFDIITADYKSIEPNNEAAKYSRGEYLSLGINTDQKVRYQVLDFKKGYYFIVKIDSDLSSKEYVGLLHNDPRDRVNPDIIMCTAQEIATWLK